MKKFYAFAILGLSAVMIASAQSKFDSAAGLYIGNARDNAVAALAKSRGTSDNPTIMPEIDPDAKVAVLVTMKDEGMGYILAEQGYEIITEMGRVVAVRLTSAEMEEVAAIDEVVQVSLGFKLEPMLNTARKVTGVDVLHTAAASSGLAHSYTGEGVVVGMMDTGLDPMHLNFHDADGNLRIKRVWDIKGATGAVTMHDTPEAIANYQTDSRVDTHASHVLGIMGGSHDAKPGSGNGSVALVNSRGKLSTGNNANPYYGVAKDAELSVCVGTLENNNVAIAAGLFSDYVEQTGKPGVMNLSLGHQDGPHDGTDASALALAAAGKKVLICISAGNEGADNISLSRSFSGSVSPLKTTLGRNGIADGYLDIWSSDARNLKVAVAALDKTTGQVQYKIDINSPVSSTWIGGLDTRYSNVPRDANFSKYFGGSSTLNYSANVNTANNRYNTYLYLGIVSADYIPAVIVEGVAGTSVDLYGSVNLASNGFAGFVDGSPSNSINALCCGDNTLSVGAYVNTNPYPSLGGMMTFGESRQVGDIAYFSSYGHTFQGRQLPDVVGPGMGMISSYNSYYVAQEIASYIENAKKSPQNTKTDAQLREEAEASYTVWINNANQPDPSNARATMRNYWGEMSGTSMSSPFVAGVLALWSQAAAEKGVRLSMDDVKKVIAATADKDEFTAQQPERWGMGKINALAGLKYILANEMGGVDGIASDDPESSLIIEPVGGGVYSVFLAGVEGFTATLHNLQGQAVATASATGNELTLDGSALGRGVYVLTVQAPNTRISRKIAL